MSTVTSELEALERAIVDHLFELQPGRAVFLGLHRYDGALPDLSRSSTEAWAEGADRLLRRLDEFPPEALERGRAVDLTLLRLLLEGPLFDLREARELERNAMAYLGTLSLTSYLVRDYAPAPLRASAIARTLAAVPALLETGRRRLDERQPEPFVRLAMTIGEGLPSHFEEAEAFARAAGPEAARAVADARRSAQPAVEEFLGRLRTEWLPNATADFALGPERFQRLLWVREGIRRPFAEILSEGEADLARNESRLGTIASGAPGGSVAALIESLNLDHPSADGLLLFAREEVERVRRFVVERDLATIPGPDRCVVEETPSYGRALSTASMNPPGPFESGGDVGVYYVTPVDPGWPAERQEEWLRSLNRPMLRNITVHEVYPGHYLQFLHHRRAGGSLVRRVYLSDAFTEGWAHYCEQLAVEAGIGGASASAEAAELHDALLRDCRLIASIGLHTGGMSLEEATRLFERSAHMERLPAEREAIRGTFNPEYFCYTLGKLGILAERARRLGPQFHGSLRAFHDRLLSFGSPPVGLLAELLEG